MKEILQSRLGRVYMCPQCDTPSNKPSVDTDALYPEEYFAKNYEPLLDAQRAHSQFQIHKILAHLVTDGPTPSALDVGCGTGIFLKTLYEHGFRDNFGLDVSPAARQLARERLRGKAEVAGAERLHALPDRRFDLISFVDSIAHIEDASAYLSALMQRHLKPAGLVFLRTPVFNSNYFRYASLLRCVLPSNLSAYAYHLPGRHLLFKENSLRVFLERNGLSSKESWRESDYGAYNFEWRPRPLIRDVFLLWIPKIVNPSDSISVIAQGV